MMNESGPIEAALSTDLRGEPYNFSLWDVNTGAQLVAFKGMKSSPNPNCLQLIDNNYFVTVNDNVIHIWSIFNRRCQDKKLFLPSRPSCLTISPCGQYIIVGIAESIYIWQLRSGNLLACSQKHYQTVSVLKMNYEGTFLFSGGEDGAVLTWSFADLISKTHHLEDPNSKKSNAKSADPRFTWQHSNGAITDIHVTNGGRCISISMDASLNIYSYANGKRLFSITMPTPLTSVTMNKNETNVYVGGQDGNIYLIAISSLGLALMDSRETSDEAARKPILVGHKGKISGLVVSSDGSRLISASHDCTCKLWDIHSRKLLNDIKHQAPLANLKSLFVPDALSLTSMSNTQVKPPLSVQPLKRVVYKYPRDGTISADDLLEESGTTIVYIKNQSNLRKSKVNLTQQENSSSTNGCDSEKEVRNLKRKLQELYEFSAEKIFMNANLSLTTTISGQLE